MSARLLSLVAWILALAIPAQALADGPLYDVHADDLKRTCWVGMPDKPAEIIEAGLSVPVLLDRYLKAYAKKDMVAWSNLMEALTTSLFELPVSEYEVQISYIDSQRHQDPAAVHELARSLEVYWKLRFGSGFSQLTSARIGGGAKAGYALGVVLLGLTVWKSPKNVPTLFKMLRALLPAIGAGSGAVAGHLVDRHLSAGAIRYPAPAELMKLGEDDRPLDLNNAELLKTILGATVGTGVSAAFVAMVPRMMRALSIATKVSSVNPVALLASLLIFYAADKGTRALVDWWQFDDLQEALYAARDRVVRAARSGNDTELYRGADALVGASLNMAAYLNKPVLDLLLEYESDLEDLQERYPRMGDWYDLKVKERTEELKEDLAEETGDALYSEESDYEGYLVRQYLGARNVAAIHELGPRGRRRAKAYMLVYQEWLDREQERRAMTLAAQDQNALFARFLAEADQAKNVELANEFVSKGMRGEAVQVMLQASALLRTTGKSYLRPMASYLLLSAGAGDQAMAGLTGLAAGRGGAP